MEREYAEYLIEKTKKDYNLIAEDFSRTRSFLPEELKELAKYVFSGQKVLDWGCGNGRFFEVLKEKKVDYFGIDLSEKLIEIAKKRYPEGKFFLLNSLSLPFPSNFFEVIFSIAVFHHIPSREFRLYYLKEAKRVLKEKGILVLRVWDFWKRKEGLKLILKYALLKLMGKTKLDFGDIFLPWKNSKGEVLVERYFHCFRKKELENLFKEVGFKIKESRESGKGKISNIYLIGEK